MGLWRILAAHGTGLFLPASGHSCPELPSGKWDGERRRNLALPIPFSEQGQACAGWQVNKPAQMLTHGPVTAHSQEGELDLF